MTPRELGGVGTGTWFEEWSTSAAEGLGRKQPTTVLLTRWSMASHSPKKKPGVCLAWLFPRVIQICHRRI